MKKRPGGPWRGGRLWLLSRKCSTCIFRPDNVMRLQPGRRDEMVAECIRENTLIPCHETLRGPRAVCRGLWDVHYRDLGLLQIADRLGIIAYCDPPEGLRDHPLPGD